MFKIVLLIIGALIGAGFASGQEIYLFFYSYGVEGIYGLMISSILFGIIIYKSLKIIIEKDIKNYDEFLDSILFNKKCDKKNKEKNKEKNKILLFIKAMIKIFMLITYYIMIAGFGSYLEESININKIIGGIILITIVIYIISKNIKGILKISEIIVPILIIFILLLGILNICNFKELNTYIIKVNNTNWIVSSILYVSYNSLLIIPILISIKEIINKKKIGYISALISLIIFILGISIFISMARINVDIKMLEMPIAYIVNARYGKLKIFYGVTILLSILTTAISIGNGLIEENEKEFKNENKIKKEKNVKKEKIIGLVIISFIGIFVAQIGFSKLINILYPIYGYLGILIFSGLFWDAPKKDHLKY